LKIEEDYLDNEKKLPDKIERMDSLHDHLIIKKYTFFPIETQNILGEEIWS
jgi:hypothetical protein